MARIGKYPLPRAGENVVEIPEGATILSAGLDADGRLCVWAVVEDERAIAEAVLFYVALTGQFTHGEGMRFIGTVRREAEVLHVFVYGETDR